MNGFYFLSAPQLQQLKSRDPAAAEIDISLDLGRSLTRVIRDGDQFQVGGGNPFTFDISSLPDEDDLRTIWIYRDGGWHKWQYFDERRSKFYKMVFVAEGAPPTVEISGVKMHVTKDGSPAIDTQRKLKALGRVRGEVLDTCCGLGYTAIALADAPGVTRVRVCEVDPNMLRLTRENPWSGELWSNKKIEHHLLSAAAFLESVLDKSLGAILHDPPRFSLGPELYSESFYRYCHRVLRAGGRMYHYTGDPHKHKGRDLPGQTLARLKKCGFRRGSRAYQGVVAIK